MTETINFDDFLIDARGRLVPKHMIPDIDQERDRLVREIVIQAQDLQREMIVFKTSAMGDVGAFVELSAEKYDVILGGQKGNVSLVSFDGRMRVQIAIAERITFDERLKAAKALVDECLTRWTDGGREEIKVLVNDAFQVDKDGCINVRQILGLRRFKINDDVWQRAMDAISDSVQVMGSKSYIRIYQRSGPDDRWRQIALDMAAL